MIGSIVTGFMIGFILAAILVRVSWGRRRLTQTSKIGGSVEAWATLLHQTLGEMKNQQVAADSQRRQAEDRASQAELLYRVIIESVPSGIATFDGYGSLVTANPVAQHLLDLEGTRLPPELTSLLEKALHGEEPPYVEMEFGAQEHSVPVGVQVRPLKGAFTASGAAGVVVVLVELTELRRLQTRARLMEELADLGQLAAGIAHEFRNATGVLRSSAEYLRTKVDNEASEAVEDLLRETERLSRVTTDLLDFARPWESNLEPVEMDELVQEVVDQLRELYVDSRITTELRCHGMTVYGRSSVLSRVVDNLVRNALEASDAPATAILRSKVLTRETGRWFKLQVLDHGKGIESRHPEELFQPFRTTKPDGTGMGLTLARKIARLHGGDVSLRNREGGGAIAELDLPLDREQESFAMSGRTPR